MQFSCQSLTVLHCFIGPSGEGCRIHFRQSLDAVREKLKLAVEVSGKCLARRQRKSRLKQVL
jgi:hypothetical protein